MERAAQPWVTSQDLCPTARHLCADIQLQRRDRLLEKSAPTLHGIQQHGTDAGKRYGDRQTGNPAATAQVQHSEVLSTRRVVEHVLLDDLEERLRVADMVLDTARTQEPEFLAPTRHVVQGS